MDIMKKGLMRCKFNMVNQKKIKLIKGIAICSFFILKFNWEEITKMMRFQIPP